MKDRKPMAPLYVLDANKRPQLAKSVLEWGEFMERIESRRVAETHFADGSWLSTVFLGLDHGYGRGLILFETMLFLPKEDGGNEGLCERFETWAEAEIFHNDVAEALNVSTALARIKFTCATE